MMPKEEVVVIAAAFVTILVSCAAVPPASATTTNFTRITFVGKNLTVANHETWGQAYDEPIAFSIRAALTMQVWFYSSVAEIMIIKGGRYNVDICNPFLNFVPPWTDFHVVYPDATVNPKPRMIVGEKKAVELGLFTPPAHSTTAQLDTVIDFEPCLCTVIGCSQAMNQFLFVDHDNASLVLQGITFGHTTLSDAHRLVYLVNGNVTLRDVDFTNITSTSTEGFVLYADTKRYLHSTCVHLNNSMLVLDRVHFTDNKYFKTMIQLQVVTTYMQHCTFINNYMTIDFFTMYFDGDEVALPMMSIGRKLPIGLYDGTGVLFTLHNCTFRGNTAVDGCIGGGDDTFITITDSLFESNVAMDSLPAISTRKPHPGGGAMLLMGRVQLNITRSRFINNHAERWGGAIVLDFQDNSGVQAFYYFDNFHIATIADSLFDGNSAGDGCGGAVSISVIFSSHSVNRSISPTVLRNNVFSNNQAYPQSPVSMVQALPSEEPEGAGMGGAIFTTASTAVYVERNTFERNRARVGGAVACGIGAIRIHDTTFHNNSASMVGGALGGAVDCVSLTTFCTFTNNTAVSGGAMVSILSPYIEHSTFLHNFAEEHGGAYYAVPPALINREGYTGGMGMTNTTMVGNVALQTGGAISSFNGDVSDSVIETSTFTDCSAGAGGAVYLDTITQRLHTVGRNMLRFTNCTFERSKSLTHSGAVYIGDARTRLAITFERCRFVDNRAILAGGAMVLTSFVCNISECVFRGNSAAAPLSMFASTVFEERNMISSTTTTTARQVGGAVSVRQKTHVHMQSSEFNDNHAGFGGAVCVEDSVVTDIGGSVFNYNVAEAAPDAPTTASGLDGGGAILHLSSNPMVIQSCRFDSNAAWKSSGGSIAVASALLETRNTTFTNNSCLLRGGAVYTYSLGYVDIRSSTFEGNHVHRGSGGAVSIETQSEVTSAMTGCLLSRNTASSTGGAVQATSVHRFDLNDTVFHQNYAVSAGAVYVLSSGFHCDSSDFDNNTSTFTGGALLLLSATGGFIKHSRFSFNQVVEGRGGAVYIQDTDTQALCFDNNIFWANSALAGGAVFIAHPSPDARPHFLSSGADSMHLDAPNPMQCSSTVPTRLTTQHYLLCGNTARYGPVYASNPSKIVWDPLDDFAQSYSGYVFENVFFTASDIYNQRVTWTDLLIEATVHVTPTNVHMVGLFPNTFDSDGVLKLNRFQIVGAASTYTLQARVSNTYPILPSRAYPISLAACEVGQFVDRFLDQQYGVCRTCEGETYNLVGGDKCRVCEKHATCRHGILTAKPGYFVFSHEGKAHVRACQIGHCIGGNQCAPHHSGELCGSCDPGFVLWRSTCTDCSTVKVVPVVIIVIVFMLIVSYFVFFAKYSAGRFGSLVFFSQAALLMMEQTVSRSSTNDDGSSTVLGDIASSIPSLMSLEMEYFQNTCFAPLTIYGKFWLTMLAPFGFLVLYGVFYACEKYLVHGGQCRGIAHKRLADMMNQGTKRERYKNAFFRLILFLYLPISRTALDMLNCTEMFPGSGDFRLVSDASVECRGTKYEAHRAISIAIAVCWTYSLPLILLAFVSWMRWKNKTIEAFAAVREQYGILLLTYTGDAFYWGPVMELRKTLLVTIYVFASLQRALLTPVDNLLEGGSLFLLCICAYILSSDWYNNPDRPSVRSDAASAINIVFIVALCSAATFVLMRWARDFKEKRKEKASSAPIYLEQRPPRAGVQRLPSTQQLRGSVVRGGMQGEIWDDNEYMSTSRPLPPNSRHPSLSISAIQMDTFKGSNSNNNDNNNNNNDGDESNALELPPSSSTLDVMDLVHDANNLPLPEDWERHETDDGIPYYFNAKTEESVWEHPGKIY